MVRGQDQDPPRGNRTGVCVCEGVCVVVVVDDRVRKLGEEQQGKAERSSVYVNKSDEVDKWMIGQFSVLLDLVGVGETLEVSE